MRILVRVDASRTIGTGHVRRMISLSHALVDAGNEVRFLWRDLDIDVAEFLPDWIGKMEALARPASLFGEAMTGPSHATWAGVCQSVDAEQTVAAAIGYAPEWIIVDHYAFDAAWHDVVRNGTDARIVAIDDLADRPLSADLIVDHNLHGDHLAKYASVNRRSCPLLGGPRYALIGGAYSRAPRFKFRPELRSIGIFMGGVDAIEASGIALDAIAATSPGVAVEVVTTRSNPHLKQLVDRAADSPNLWITIDIPDLTDFYARHDLQIGAGGGALWERCCIGAPTLVVICAENQREVAINLARRGYVDIADATGERETAVVAVGEALRRLVADQALRANLASASRALVDGRGSERVALYMTREAVEMQAASMEDSDLILEWRNHPKTRLNSRSSEPIQPEQHHAWLEDSLSNSDKILLIGKIGKIPVGVIRFDARTSKDCEVSLYLDPDLTGLGLGPLLLQVGERMGGRGRDVRAEVLAGNVASERMFLASGYRRIGRGQFIKTASPGKEQTR